MIDLSSKTLEATRNEEISTAYHEAGHAVVALVFGLTGLKVTIVPGEGSLGHYLHPGILGYEVNGIRERRRLARDCILVSYAGMHAQRLVDPNAKDAHGAMDESNAFNLSREFGVFPRSLSRVGDESHIRFLNFEEESGTRCPAESDSDQGPGRNTFGGENFVRRGDP